MFFIVQSDDSFNFPPGWIKYIAIVKYYLQIIVHVLFITTLAFLQDCRIKLQWAPKISRTVSQGLMTRDQVGPWATQDPKTKWCWEEEKLSMVLANSPQLTVHLNTKKWGSSCQQWCLFRTPAACSSKQGCRKRGTTNDLHNRQERNNSTPQERQIHR